MISVLRKCYTSGMRTISQRELRNDSADVMRQVARGASFRVTNRGTPVAVLSPVEDRPGDGLTLREGTGRMEFPPGVRTSESTEDALAELRGDR